MQPRSSDEQKANEERGIQYANGGIGAYDSVHYPDPKRIQEIHKEWEHLQSCYTDEHE